MKRFVTVLLTDVGDAAFEAIKVMVGGTTSVRIAKLLNFAVSQMTEDECYLETGVFTGFTLISAHWQNFHSCIGIDPYADMKEVTPTDSEKIREQARSNIRGMAPRAELIERDFRDVQAIEIPKKVAVSFVDAKHDYKHVMDNLVWLEPLLADDALLFFDDITFQGVGEAISEWQMKHTANYDLIVYVKPFYHDNAYVSSVTDRFLNQGLCVLRYHKDPKKAATLSLVS